MRAKIKVDIRKVVIYGLMFFLILSIAYTSILVTVVSNSSKDSANQIKTTESQIVTVERNILSSRINKLVSDVLFISDSIRLSGFDEDSLEYITNEWVAFSERKKIYDQIRFIDTQGNEIIRINYSVGGSYSVDKSELQNKRDRYYFEDAIGLSRNQVFISKLDLNIENNQIEEPIKPMIRFSTPVYDESENLMGIVVLNYYGNDILEQIQQVSATSYGHVFLLNSDSFWLYNGEDNEKSWAFMYENRLDENFKKEFADEWYEIKENKNGSIITDNGLFTYSNILTEEAFIKGHTECELILDEGDWYIVSYVPGDSDSGEFFGLEFKDYLLIVLRENLAIYIFLLFMSTLFAVLMNMNRVQKERTKYFSEYDNMTGVYNRRAGIERLSRLYKDANKSNGKMSICFIDINGLKEVNDHFGHDAGDELILTVVSGIKKNIRESDFVTRLGGDEFLIIFNNTSAEGAECIWDRISGYYNYINENEKRKYIVSASHGIEDFKFNANEYIDKIVNSADEKMYNEKRIIKKDLKVIRGEKL